MKRQSVLLPKYYTLGIFCFLAAMFLIGSFFDYPISKMLYNSANGFGIFLAAFGEYPAALGFTAAGALLLIARSKENKLSMLLQYLGGGLLIFFGTVMAAMMPSRYIKIPLPLLICIGLLCSGAVIFLMIRLCKNANRKTILRTAAVIFFVIFAEMLLVNLIKIPWGRPRMRLVSVNPEAFFMPWWMAGSELKNTLMAAGVAAEEFKSFPSGHTANAATLILLGLIPLLNQKLANKKILLVSIGFGWGCLVAFSRIIMGAHYLTDTVVGFGVSLVVMLLLSNIMLGNQTQELSTASHVIPCNS